jgi:hypothetical protein
MVNSVPADDVVVSTMPKRHLPPPIHRRANRAAQPAAAKATVAVGRRVAPPPIPPMRVAGRAAPVAAVQPQRRLPPGTIPPISGRHGHPPAQSGHQPTVAPSVLQAKRLTAPPPPRGVVQRMEDPNKGHKFFRDEIKGSYSGRNDSGVSFGVPVLRGPRSYSGEEVEQFMRHLSVFFWNYARDVLLSDDQEVETMFVNDRVVVSSNKPSTMTDLFDMLLEEDTLLDAFLTALDIEDKRSRRTVERFQEEMTSPDQTSDLQAMVQGLGAEEIKNSIKKARVRRAGNAGRILTDPAYEEKLIFIEGLDAHAEQKLLILLVQSGLAKTTETYVRGKKRPCFGCWLCLRYVRDALGYTGLNFNDRPGKAWLGALDELLTFVKLGLKFKVKKAELVKWANEMIDGYQKNKIKTHISQTYIGKTEDPGHDSESDDDLDRYKMMT